MTGRELLSPGEILKKRYVILKELGQGGFGNTYLAKDPVLDCMVAVKEYRENIERFLYEARITAKFRNCREVVYVYDFFQEYGAGYIVMEYLEGETLKECLAEEGHLEKREALRIIREVLKGLSLVHREGYLHRDIAPDNIFLLKSGGVKLFDFGCAERMGEENRIIEIKKSYSPPEQFVKGGVCTRRSDVYAASATLFRMLTGKEVPSAPERSKEGARPDAALLRKRAGKKLAGIILKNLSMNPEKRNGSCEAFLKELKGENSMGTGFLLAAACLAIPAAAFHGRSKTAVMDVTEEYVTEKSAMETSVFESTEEATAAETETATETEKTAAFPPETLPESLSETESEETVTENTVTETVGDTEGEKRKEPATEAEYLVEDPGGW